MHTATYAPADGGGYLVTCPHGCSLGTSASQPDEEGAQRRVRLHKLATAVASLAQTEPAAGIEDTLEYKLALVAARHRAQRRGNP